MSSITLRRPPQSAIRRLRQVRWSMTVFFTVATTCCLVALGTLAFNADQEARARQSDQQLATLASHLAAGVQERDERLRFDSSTLSQLPPASEPIAFVDQRGIELANPGQASLPVDAVISHLTRAAWAGTSTVFENAPGPGGVPYRWAALSLPVDLPAAVVVGAAANDPTERGRFLTTLIAAISGLVLLAGATGHLLSGLAMRPAMRALAGQEQFLREAAHELRTPLAALQMALHTAHDAGPREAGDAVARADRRVEELTRMVDWLLLRARTEAGTTAIELRPLRLDQVVDVALDEFGDQPRLTRYLDSTVVLGNAELITHAVRNLVENALRYTDGPIEVSVTGTALRVEDGGPAERTSPTALTSEKGTGSGLSIVRWITDIHRTVLQLSPNPPMGLTASIDFRAP